ncbi:Enolase 1, chloroplastic [Glycine soja]|uniref:phosphopyruvate hydratase n=1 Tax=Glycine soja TaxID=3848 RepID=A0A0B2RJ42_GLYSO|nr:Enolase 1, chloroplastic [Glycine soja]
MSKSSPCTYCGEASFIHDDISSELICSSCGGVQQFDQFDGPQGTFIHALCEKFQIYYPLTFLSQLLGAKKKNLVGFSIATSQFRVALFPTAASEFYTKDGKYDLNFMKQPNDGAHVHSTQSLGQLYKNYVKEFPIVSIKDPFDQDDWGSWASLLASVDIQLVDDLLVTNPKRIAEAIKKKACNGLLLKVNQIGTVTESIQAALDSKAAGWGVVVSHRSGETEDNFIADLSVGLASGQTKTGAPCRSERLAKYNQLLRIEEELGSVQYAGETFRSP